MEGDQTGIVNRVTIDLRLIFDSTGQSISGVLSTQFWKHNFQIFTMLLLYGSCLNIPRKGDKNLLYIQLSNKDVMVPLTGRVDKNRIVLLRNSSS
jgi:hypothetical protein